MFRSVFLGWAQSIFRILPCAKPWSIGRYIFANAFSTEKVFEGQSAGWLGCSCAHYRSPALGFPLDARALAERPPIARFHATQWYRSLAVSRCEAVHTQSEIPMGS
jgi:hypothetical protein